MCTVSLIALDDAGAPGPSPGGSAISKRCFRLACNRDESRNRPEARLPEVRPCGAFKAVLPVDPVSDGTWIAVNEAGMTATLLNTYERPASQRPPRDSSTYRSRGTIVPAIMGCARAIEAASVMTGLAVTDYPPFMVVVTDGRDVIEYRSDGRQVDRIEHRWDGKPLLFTTSGLGDDVVYGPRRVLFDECFTDSADPAAAQDRYHLHQWPDRPHLSVCMSRPEARTVSQTTVQVGRREISLTYRPIPSKEEIPAVELSMARRARD